MILKACVMRPKGSLSVKVYDNLFRGFSGLRDVELSVGRVMRKYGEDREMEGLIFDDISTDDTVAIHIAGEEEVSDYWEGLKKNGGEVIGVCEYLYERFSSMYRRGGSFDEAGYVDMLKWVLDEARRFEGEIGG